jgi:hypothetical protein
VADGTVGQVKSASDAPRPLRLRGAWRRAPETMVSVTTKIRALTWLSKWTKLLLCR